jgi:hypothetical protein
LNLTGLKLNTDFQNLNYISIFAAIGPKCLTERLYL